MTTPGSEPNLAAFDTARLTVRHWAPEIAAPLSRQRLADDLAPMLVPEVTHFLPDEMQLAPGSGAVFDWIARTDAAARAYTIRRVESRTMVGLMLLHPFVDETGTPGAMLGYFIGPNMWGQGYATELVRGLVCACENGPSFELFAGVDAANVPSQRVLENAGFRADPAPDTADQLKFRRSCGQAHNAGQRDNDGGV